jgi:hypothetical protein
MPDGSAHQSPDSAQATDSAEVRHRGEPGVDLRGEVVDGRGRPASEMLVFAVERGSPRIVAAARPDPDGLFVMKLAARVHDFGLLSSHWLISGYQATSPTSIKLVVYEAFPETTAKEVVKRAKSWTRVAALPEETTEGSAAPSRGWSGSAIARVTGTVTDETGVPLQGVRLLGMQDRTERLVSVTQTDHRGRYTLVTVAGPNRLYVHAPGLRLKEGRVKSPGRLDLTLEVDTEIDSLTLWTGRRLAFRMSDSIYPEMLPPPRVAAALSFDYGIALANGCFCPGDLLNQPPPTVAEERNACLWSRKQSSCASATKCPATVWARQCRVPQHWWLRLIQTPPPNPNRLWQGSIPMMWWYDTIRAMQEDDAAVRAKVTKK